MNSSLISQAFKNTKKEKRPALLTYTVAGDNSKKKSLENFKINFKLCRYLRTRFSS
jgi:tryptophan synthase alpha chain